MDKKRLMELKNVDIFKTSRMIQEKIPREVHEEEIFKYIVGFAVCAYWFGEAPGAKAIFLKKVQDLFTGETNQFLSKLIMGYFDTIEFIFKSSTPTKLLATALFLSPYRFRRHEIYGTPDGITRLALALLDIHDEDIVLDLGSGTGSFILEAGFESKEHQLFGVDDDNEMIIVANIRAALTDVPVKIIKGDILKQSFKVLRANKIFSNFPFALKLPDLDSIQFEQLRQYFSNAKRNISTDWLFATAAKLNLVNTESNYRSKAVVLMSNGGTWNEFDRKIRSEFVAKRWIEAVISLPERLLPANNKPVTMMVFSEGNESVRMIDATEFCTNRRRSNSLEDSDIQQILACYHGTSDKSRLVSSNEIAEQDFILNPIRYIQTNDIKNARTLGQISRSINRGIVIPASTLNEITSNEPTKYQHLLLQNVHDGWIDDNLAFLKELDHHVERACVQDGNLLISKISPFKITLVHIPENRKVVASGNMYFLDIDEAKMNPMYVMLYLQSERGRKELSLFAKGVVMQSISLRDLGNVRILDIPRSEQDMLAAQYQELSSKLQNITRQEEVIKAQIANLLNAKDTQ